MALDERTLVRETATPSFRPARLGTFIERHLAAAFVGPTMVLLILMILGPLVFTGYLSLQSWTGGLVPPRYVGLTNFAKLFGGDPRFTGALLRTFAFAAMAVIAETILGAAIALLLHRPFPGRSFAQSVMLLPVIATPVAVALVWRLMYQPDLGLFNSLLGALGISPSTWVAEPGLALPLIALVDIWQWTGFMTLMTMAALSALPQWPFEAAAVDGASAFQTLRHITLPMIRPVIIAAMAFRAIDALKTFDLILVITGGGPANASETVDIYAYKATFAYQQLGYASAMLIVFFIIVIGATALIAASRGRA